MTDAFKNVPRNVKKDLSVPIPQIKDKIGLFIVEMQGNGKVSRAVIKKGSLTLVHRATEAGHLAFIIDQDRNICKSETTGVWMNKKFYASKPKFDGAIFIPYGSTEQTQQIVMIHNNFAQMGEFQQLREKYEFSVFFHANNEQFLVGQEAQVMIRPKLLINGMPASLKLLKNIKVSLSIDDFIGNPSVTRQYPGLDFSEGKDTIIKF